METGRRVLWLHTFAERYADPVAGHPAGRVPQGAARLLEPIPAGAGELPEEPVWEDGALVLGAGRIAPVGEEIWRYEVSTMRVLKHWLEYRMRAPAGRGLGALDQVVADAWPHSWTEELLELIWVLEALVALEPGQDALLREITAGPTISCSELAEAGVLPVDERARKAPAGGRPAGRPAGHDHTSLLDGHAQ